MFPISDSVKAPRFPALNILFIILTVYVFFQEVFTPNPDALIQTYALIPARVNFSDISTLTPFVTAIFLHGGFLHIISNMWFLWIFGDNVEGYLGWFLYPVLYFTAGIIGNIVQYVLMPVSDIPMLGASGAIAGVLGAYYILFPYSKIKTLVPIFFFLTILDISAPLMLGYWFLLQLISGAATIPFTGGTGGIAFFAHVGGFITGMVFVSLIAKKEHSKIYG